MPIPKAPVISELASVGGVVLGDRLRSEGEQLTSSQDFRHTHTDRLHDICTHTEQWHAGAGDPHAHVQYAGAQLCVPHAYAGIGVLQHACTPKGR